MTGPMFAALVQLPAPLGAMSPARLAELEEYVKSRVRHKAARAGYTEVEFGETWIGTSCFEEDGDMFIQVAGRGVS